MPGDAGLSLPADGSLADALSALKRAGSNLLVVGTVTGDAGADACRRLFGDDDTDRRHLLVFTDADADRAVERVPCSAADDAVTVVDGATTARGGAVASIPGAATPEAPEGTAAPGGPQSPGTAAVATREADGTDLAALGTTISDALDDAVADADELDPAELRLCVDSLLPLLAENDEEAVFRFLHVLTGRVRQHRGMGHYHLPVAREEPVARRFAPLFDAVVELRVHDGVVQQRWHVHEADVSSDWLPV